MAEAAALEPAFVGESRRLLVEGLLDLFDERSAKDAGPLWVSLEAPTGWGKTRVARELYRRLAGERQRAPAYWPASILGAATSGVDGVAQRRKRVFPERVNRPAGSLPDWFWWGLTCSERNGVPSQALVADLAQFEVHRVLLDKAWRVRRSALQRLGDEATGAFGALRRASVDEAVSMVLESGVTSLVGTATGLGPVVALGQWFASRVREADVGRQSSTLQAGGASADIVDDVAAALVQLATDGVPLVVCVEDLHLADDLLLELLTRLMRSDAAVLLLTTTWPGLLDDKAPLQGLVAAVDPDQVLRVRSGQPTLAALPPGAALGAFTPNDLAVVVRFYHPLAEDDTVRLLVEHYGQPLPLELVCSLPWVQQVAEDQAGRLRLDPDEVTELPTEVEDIYRLWWAQLPEPARQALVLSAWAIPDSVLDSDEPPVWGADERWDRGLVAGAAAAVLAPSVDLAGAMDTSTAYAWARHVVESLDMFHEPPQRDIALAARGVLRPRARREFLTALVAALTDGGGTSEGSSNTDPGPPGGEAAVNRARTLLALHAEDLLGDSRSAVGAVLAACLTISGSLAGLPRETRRVIDVATLGIDLAAPHVTAGTAGVLAPPAQLRWRRASALDRLGGRDDRGGRVLVAVHEWGDLLEQHELELGPDHQRTLTVRANLALALQAGGNLALAVPAFEATLADMTRVLGPDHHHTMIVRGNLATGYLAAGDLARAVPAFEATLDAKVRVLGPDHPDTLTTQNNLAAAYEDTGDLARAVPAFEAAVADRLRVLGPDHPNTLASRNRLAGVYQAAGDVGRAVPAFEATLADMTRVLGPDHPDTLRSRDSTAGVYQAAGDVGRAVPAFEATLADMTRVLGPDHPDTLQSRNGLALAYRAAGNLALAVPAFEATLADMTRVLGPDHPETLRSRNNLALAYQDAGDLGRAVPAFEAALADRLRVLGPDHPNTLTLRINLAAAQQAAGDLARAVPAFEATLADMTRVLGPDHPSTLFARLILAGAYKNTGDLARAVPAIEAVLADMTRVLGPESPHTLSSRNNLALAYRDAGDLGRAVPAFEATLDDMTRVLGPDHPDTLAARNNLAGAYQAAGDLDRAVPAFEAVRSDAMRVLGPDSPRTVVSRNNLAEAYRAVGDLGRAASAYTDVLDALLRTPETVIPGATVSLSRWRLAECLLGLGEYGRALEQFQRLLAHLEVTLGTEHRDALLTRRMLGETLIALGETAQARELLHDACAVAVRVLAADDAVRTGLEGSCEHVHQL